MSEYKNADTSAVIMENISGKMYFWCDIIQLLILSNSILNQTSLYYYFYICGCIYNLSLKHLALVLHSFD